VDILQSRIWLQLPPSLTPFLPALSLRSLLSQVRVTPPPGKKLEHVGVKIELLGQIELFFERGNFYDFISLGALKP
jgi:hypothetical protein